MKLHHLFIILATFAGLMAATPASAQSNKRPNWELGATTGPHLPSNLPGVTEVLPFAGIRLSTGVHSFRPELLLTSINAEGVTWYQSSLSVRNWIALEDLGLFWNVGFHYVYYRRAPESSNYPFVADWGWHFGFGNIWPISEHVSFRSDVLLHQRPGRFLQVGLGFQFELPSSGQGTN